MLDPNDDYTFGRRNAFHTGAGAVAQAVKTRLRLLKGEWWENIGEGTPVLEDMAGRFFPSFDDAAQVDLIIAERITGTQGVTEITAFDSAINPYTRTYTAVVTVGTVYGVSFQADISDGDGVLRIAMKGGYANGVL